MLYTCTNCRLILPNELAMNLKECPVCGKTPHLDFKTAESLLSQGYRHYNAQDPGPRTPPADPPPRRGSVSIPDVPVEAPSSTTTQATSQPPVARGGNSRLDWMNQRETPASAPKPPTHPAPGPRNNPEPARKPNPPQTYNSTPGYRSAPQSQPGITVVPPVRRPGGSQSTETGSSTIEGGPTGKTPGTGPFDPSNINISFIFQLLLLLAVSIVVGILIYSVWSMREQITQYVTKILTFVLIGVVAVFMPRRRR